MSRLGLVMFAIFFFVVSAIFSASAGVANLYAEKSRGHISAWEKDGIVSSESSWKEANGKMKVATSLAPFDADYSFDMGRLYEWDALRHEIWEKKAKDSRSVAIEWYKRAITGRPSFGLAWANLAQSKVLNQEIDDETIGALELAMIYGPWEPVLQQKVIWVGMAIWFQLPEPLKSKLTVSISRALRNDRQGKFVIEAAIKLGRTAILRPLLTEKKHIDLLEREIQRRSVRENASGSI